MQLNGTVIGLLQKNFTPSYYIFQTETWQIIKQVKINYHFGGKAISGVIDDAALVLIKERLTKWFIVKRIKDILR